MYIYAVVYNAEMQKMRIGNKVKGSMPVYGIVFNGRNGGDI